MGLFSFIKEAGEKLFGGKDAAAAPQDLNAAAGAAIEKYIATQNLGVSDVKVAFDAGQVTVTGTAPTQAAKEKVTLCCGNVSSVSGVDNQMSVTNPEPEAQYHDVVSGDNLSKISKQYYGDPNKYNVIFEANKPMLSDPNKIYPGQKLRIPAL